MNYLERLIRRAMLQANQGQGGAVYDPFQREAVWDLDRPAPPPDLRVEGQTALRQPALSPAPTVANAPSQTVEEWPGAMEEIVPRPDPGRQAIPPGAGAVTPTSESSVPVRQARPPSIAESLSPIAIPPSSDGLADAMAQADQFMRSLRLPMPQLLIQEEAQAPRQMAVQTIQPVPSAKPAPHASLGETLAENPVPRLRPPVSRPAETVPPAEANRKAKADDTKQEASPVVASKRLVSTATQVIVVQEAGLDVETQRIGVGAPYFGLGQL